MNAQTYHTETMGDQLQGAVLTADGAEDGETPLESKEPDAPSAPLLSEPSEKLERKPTYVVEMNKKGPMESPVETPQALALFRTKYTRAVKLVRTLCSAPPGVG